MEDRRHWRRASGVADPLLLWRRGAARARKIDGPAPRHHLRIHVLDGAGEQMTPFTVRLTFHGDLSFFLKLKKPRIQRQLSERTSVKDVIEACGVPHTEVDLILVDQNPVDFDCVLTRQSAIDVYPIDWKRHTLFQ